MITSKDLYKHIMDRANAEYYKAKVAKNPNVAYRAPELVVCESDQIKSLAKVLADVVLELVADPEGFKVKKPRKAKP